MGADFDAGWARVGDQLKTLVTDAQVQAAQDGLDYVPRVLTETGQSTARIEALNAQAFAGMNRRGVPIEEVLHVSVIRAKQAIGAGLTIAGALAEGRKFLMQATPSILADTDRNAVQASLTAAGVDGYVRMLSPPSCHRCVILAGRWYRWNKGFQRHPGCDCRHIPSAENVAGDFATDPYEYFFSLSEAEQNAVFGKRNAQAIRDGADIYRVSNVRTRGLATERASRRYGTPRISLDEIYREAGGSRARAIELMKEHGYILGPQTIRQQTERFATPISRPVRPGSARERVLKARETGVRDPLDRATMTEQERRLFDATYRLEYARRHGYVPRSVGLNSADVYSGARGVAATPDFIAQLEADLQQQLARIGRGQSDMHLLALELGLLDGRSDIIHERIYQQMIERFQSSTHAKRQLSLADALKYV